MALRVTSPTRPVLGRGLVLDQPFAVEQLGDARHGVRWRGRRLFGRRRRRFLDQREIEQSVGVVEGRAQHLAARQVLIGRRDAPSDRHLSGVDRLARAEARQRRAVGPQQEDRFDQVAARLLDRQRRECAVVERSLGHHPVDRERQLRRRSAPATARASPGSPRRSSASRRWAFSIAFSPPFTATYISRVSFRLRTRDRARSAARSAACRRACCAPSG